MKTHKNAPHNTLNIVSSKKLRNKAGKFAKLSIAEKHARSEKWLENNPQFKTLGFIPVKPTNTHIQVCCLSCTKEIPAQKAKLLNHVKSKGHIHNAKLDSLFALVKEIHERTVP